MSAEQNRDAGTRDFAAAALDVTTAACRTARGSWPETVHAGLTALFDLLADCPERTRNCMEAWLDGGTSALEQRDRALARFARLLEPGSSTSPRRPPPVVAEAIAGGIYELIRTHVKENRVEEISDALPVATVIVLTPFVGDVEAERQAARPISVRANP